MELHDEDWELVNDDGFVYKRLKRPPVDPTIAATSTGPLPDPAAEERSRKERKKMILLNLKTKYQKEIHHWEHLSNTLKAFLERTQTQPPPSTVSLDLPVALSKEHLPDSTHWQIAENLLAQVEAQEAHLNEVSTLCDVAESLCNAQEQRLKQAYVYLPIWESSPRKLITSLCEE